MGQKEKANAKKLTKLAIKQIKTDGKKDDVKAVGGIIFKNHKNFFFRSIIKVRYMRNEFWLYGSIVVKPYSLDDLLWEIFDIPENKNEPISLRANGAYVAPSVELDVLKVKVDSEDTLNDSCNDFLMSLNETIESFLQKVNSIESFFKFVKHNYEYKNNELLYILLEIHLENYSEALSLLDAELGQNKTGGFKAEGKSIYEYAKEFCEEKLLTA